MIPGAPRRWDGETLLVAAFAACISLFSFVYYARHGDLLLYGDAVAHINIARRVFDSRTPGLLQLGTVWLPLPHLLMIPFLLSDSAWQTGVGGSVPSLIAYVLSVVGVFRLVRRALSFPGEPDLGARLTAWFATAAFAANPNLIYLQTTAMTEVPYLAFFIWALVFFSEFVQSLRPGQADIRNFASGSLMKCALCVAAAEATRYDGWFLGVSLAVAVFLTSIAAQSSRRLTHVRVWPATRNFMLIVAAVPAIWFGYNGAVYRNPLEFANGPYSAKAIEARTSHPGFPPHPGSQNVVTATQYFVKAAESNLAEGSLQKYWIALAIAGTLSALLLERALWPLLLLWVPMPFYVLSIAYGGVPVFVPSWWPFSYYNVRYGIELLPAFSVGVALAIYFATSLSRPKVVKIALAILAVIFVGASYLSAWRAQPVSYREAWVNSRTRIALETALANNLRLLPKDAAILMYLGDHVGALQRAGIPLHRVINEGNHRTWKRPADPGGLWERALADPASLADYAIGIDDDPVSSSAREHGLRSMAIVEATGQPRATIYFTKASP
jgi:hypothetical protein